MDARPVLPSRAKRSTTNLANLRLAPLSSRFAEPVQDLTANKPRTSYLETPDLEFARQHSSYIQGRSAPTTPGILSRTTSRTHLGGGLSRRGSLYDNENDEEENGYEYAATRLDSVSGARADVGSGRIPKAKSEAALLPSQQHQKSTKATDTVTKKKRQVRTPRTPKTSKPSDDDWLTRTGAAANALLQESKGQSWLASRESSTTSVRVDSTDDDDDDDQYEEMAALSAVTSRFHDESTLTTPRVSRWGSRYGSRSASRRGSITGSRTPTAHTGVLKDGPTSYFDGVPLEEDLEPDWVDRAGEDSEDAEVARLTATRSFGLGGVVDTLMNFRLFKVDEREESTEDEAEPRLENETDEQAKKRMAAELKRRREEKLKLVAPAPGTKNGEDAEQVEGAHGWQDAAWLLSVASKALF